MHQLDARITAEIRCLGRSNCLGIPIQGQKQATSPYGIQHGPAVTTASEGTVNRDISGTQGQPFQSFS
jgi:hypothetical protein